MIRIFKNYFLQQIQDEKSEAISRNFYIQVLIINWRETRKYEIFSFFGGEWQNDRKCKWNEGRKHVWKKRVSKSWLQNGTNRWKGDEFIHKCRSWFVRRIAYILGVCASNIFISRIFIYLRSGDVAKTIYTLFKNFFNNIRFFLNFFIRVEMRLS